MPIKLLPRLHLVNHPFPLARFPLMKLQPFTRQCRTIPIFSRVFPFKLKYASVAFSSRPSHSFQAVRRSSVPVRGSERGRFGGSKSLAEDEAELSDWVSDLKTSSFRGRITSDEESEEDHRRSRGRDRESPPLKKGRDRQSYELREFSEGRRPRGPSMESYAKNSGNVRRFKREYEDEREDFRSRSNGRVFRRDNVDSSIGRGRATREINSRNQRIPGRDSLGRSGRESKNQARFASEGEREEDEEDDDDEGSRIKTSVRDFLSDEDSTDDDNDDDEDNSLLRKSTSALFPSGEKASEKDRPRNPPRRSDSYLSETRFDQCSISPLSLKGIKDAGYEKMTVVQEATLPLILKGKDVLAKAKTGTGKTVAFLLPSIEVVVKSPPNGDQKRPPILVLVICPTRELATQAATEANTLLKYHPTIGVQVVIGGTRLALEQKRMQANPCQILVATPGRLKDHIENTAGFATRLMGVKVLVLDEADHLLDMGFRKDIERIVAAVPKQRQTLLFSATVPDEVRQISHIALRRDHEFVNTIQEGSEDTHAQVRQMQIVAPLEKHFSLLYAILKEHIADDVDYKVLVFCTTAMVTRMVADLLGELNLNIREIHSRKPQSYRTRVSDEFRKSKGLILVTSDVSARGVDYPDVTLVIQVGLPADREQYIHRLGRTGRKGKEGQGILLLAPWEEFFLSTVKDLPISKAPMPLIDLEAKKKVDRALAHVEMKNKEAAYQAWLGYYNSNKTVGRDKYRLVELANEFSRSMGLDNPPAIPKLVLGKMGLKNIPGLRVK
ncbi:DEAD-box ATP-dependent RNA helicase 31-like [Benincasa hispida]|uniref:DEAD-box ATP-dependent RNA helicase 31-like n=1 Tax=Benincasa hispida TaxID=102211 RepID=UPI001901B41A|nr:DEAD-box ATP-dependent RNA helicase 31-like [Benincasa hispida]